MAIIVACALALLRAGPLWAGATFLVIGVGIAPGAVAGRYHYTADVILGVVTAAAAWLTGIGLVGFGRCWHYSPAVSLKLYQSP